MNSALVTLEAEKICCQLSEIAVLALAEVVVAGGVEFRKL